ncbi:MAG: sulfatase-like hydrolase/transferase [Fuerstiella sp.]|nr:sulfatase-like hydrolase/transferase [Fuerstiella sp.]MCP4854537.1 sulfatase-like hydrolase/transferase [Fuerstiella sp.]
MNAIHCSFGVVLKIGGSAIVLWQCLVGTLSASETIAKPNIIFVMADDLGYGDLGCYGQQVIKTPHIDQLATGGLRFTHCYAGSTVCAPSRSVLMTGKHTGHTTVRGNFGTGGVQGLGGGKGRVPLRKQDVTVAEILKQAGYVTGMTGKWGLGEPNTSGEPNSQGFDEWFGYLNQRRAHTYYPTFIWRNRQRVDLDGNLDGKQQELDDRFLYWEFFEGGFQQAVRWGNWKAVILKPGQEMELYDLANDVGETKDVASQNPIIVTRIEAYLKTARTESKEFPTTK